jgi:ribosomal protein S8E
MSNVGSEKDYRTKEEAKNNLQWGEESTTRKLLHIAKINQHPRFEDLPIYMSQNV